LERKGKERNADLYSAYRLTTSKRSDVDHTELRQSRKRSSLLLL